ncbi:MAG: glycosyltransferase family 2 protein [Cyanobacteria bacterium P01_A01_bin.17]
MPKVSIGLPVYNGENFLGDAIASLLSQTFTDFELLISDNASTDSTEEICRSFVAQDSRVKYRRNSENLGAAPNYTQVFEWASAPYFKWAAHDDAYEPEFLAKCIEVLDQDSSVVLCYTRGIDIDAAGRYMRDWQPRPQLAAPLPHQRFQAVFDLMETLPIWGVVRSEILAQTPLLGNYAAHDLPLLSRLSLYGRLYEVPEPLFLHREHPQRSIYVYDWRLPHDAISWYDSKKIGKLTFPAWRLLAEHFAGIQQTPIPLSEKIRCLKALSGWVSQRWLELLRDIIFASQALPGGTQLHRGYEHLLAQHRVQVPDPLVNQLVTDMTTHIPQGEQILIADAGRFPPALFDRWQVIPFPDAQITEEDEPPADQRPIVIALEQQCQEGVSYLAVTWPLFTWFNRAQQIQQHLDAHCTNVLRNDLIQIFALKPFSHGA